MKDDEDDDDDDDDDDDYVDDDDSWVTYLLTPESSVCIWRCRWVASLLVAKWDENLPDV